MGIKEAFARLFANKSGPRPGHLKPRLEWLEHRLAPATMSFTGAVNTDWGNPGELEHRQGADSHRYDSS